jgi:hypothetical protein
MAVPFRANLALAAIAATVAGCGQLDNNTWFASRYRDAAQPLFQPAATPRQADPQPEIKALIRDNVASVFLGSNATNVRVGPPRRNGYGWTACVKADITGVSKQNIGTQTILVEIDDGRIGLRRRATAEDRCDSATFEPV